MQWFLNGPSEFSWQFISYFFAKIWNYNLWQTFDLANLWVLIFILIPGFALSYSLQPKKIELSLRLCFALALGFLLPLILFYLLGVTHLYYQSAWLICGFIVSAISLYQFHGKFLEEWKESKTQLSSKILYAGIFIFFLVYYISFSKEGTIDFDILFGQIGPANYLFNAHFYNPFDMGVIPILRHELFPGPISYNSAFMIGNTPWVGPYAAMILISTLTFLMIEKVTGSRMAAFLSLVTFFGFRMHFGRGTAVAMIFLFGFFLLPKIYAGLTEGEKTIKELVKPIIAGSIFVALTLYTNIEIAAILLGVFGIAALLAWLSNNKTLMRLIFASFAGGFLLYVPWFTTVSLLLFKKNFWIFLIAYFAIILVFLLMLKLPKLNIKENLLSKIFLAILFVLGTASFFVSDFISIVRLPSILAYSSLLAALVILIYSFKTIDFRKNIPIISVFLFVTSFVVVYPYLRPVFVSIGAPEKVLYFLFDKGLGSVFPETITKVYEYFLPIFLMTLIAYVLDFVKEKWPLQKIYYYLILAGFLYFSVLRIQSSDYLDNPHGQTLGANIYFIFATDYSYAERPRWYSHDAQEIIEILETEKKKGDTFFNFVTIHNPYYPDTQFPYIVSGVGSVGLDKEDLVAQNYSKEQLDQLVSVGTDFIIFKNSENSPEVWLNDSRVKILKGNDSYILAKIIYE